MLRQALSKYGTKIWIADLECRSPRCGNKGTAEFYKKVDANGGRELFQTGSISGDFNQNNLSPGADIFCGKCGERVLNPN